MSQGELIISLVSALAWPVTALVLALVLRGPLSGLITRAGDGRSVRRLRAGPVEVEWEQRLDEVNRRLAWAHAQMPWPSPPLPSPDSSSPGAGVDTPPSASTEALSELLPLAETNPTAAVMLAYQRVEAALSQQAASAYPPAAAPPPPGQPWGQPFAPAPISPEVPQRPAPSQPTPPGGSPGNGGAFPPDGSGTVPGPGPSPGYIPPPYDPGYAASPYGVQYQVQDAVDELRRLRNEVSAYSSEGVVTPARAAQYVGIAEGVLQGLKSGRYPPAPPTV